jgi:hypothetical protein
MELTHLKQGDELVLMDDVTLHAWIFHEVDQVFFDGYVRIRKGSIFHVKVDWEAFAIGKEVPLTLSLPLSEYALSHLDYFDGEQGAIVTDMTMDEFKLTFRHFAPAPVLTSL